MKRVAFNKVITSRPTRIGFEAVMGIHAVQKWTGIGCVKWMKVPFKSYRALELNHLKAEDGEQYGLYSSLLLLGCLGFEVGDYFRDSASIR